MGYTEEEKQIYAVLLVAGLLIVFLKAFYEWHQEEKFSIYSLLHPVKKLTIAERHFIAENIIPFQDFNSAQKKTFLKRFAWFISKKPFVFYGDIQNKEEIKSYVAASAVLVTMGLKSYKFENAIKRVVVYPSKYYSKIAKRHHIGEYNPRLKTLVFSAEDVKEGFRIPNDNVNLGLHEIAHALMIETRKRGSWEAKRFKVGLRKLSEIYNSAAFQNKLANDTYFRTYATTNFFEFFAVLVESFFESRSELQSKYSEMHSYLEKMLNQ